MAMQTAIKIANYFLRKGDAAKEDERLSNLKLQKLLYYAQCASLAETGHELFSDDIEAWQHGPVVKSVYDAFSAYESNAIPGPRGTVPRLDKKTKAMLDTVGQYFGQYSAWKLRELTHEEASWQAAYKNKRSKVLKLDAMAKDYRDRWQDAVHFSGMSQVDLDAALRTSGPTSRTFEIAQGFRRAKAS